MIDLEVKIASFVWDEVRVVADLMAAAGRGIAAAAIFLTERIKEFISVQAPRRIVDRVIGQQSGKTLIRRKYLAKTRATPGAPPRRLSGALRRKINWTMLASMVAARVGVFARGELIMIERENEVILQSKTGEEIGRYARRHEYGNHPFIGPMIAAWMGELVTIIGDEFVLGMP